MGRKARKAQSEKVRDYLSQYEMPFGKYVGKTLDEISVSPEGLLYLEWVSENEDKFPNIAVIVDKYLSNPEIQEDLLAAREDAYESMDRAPIDHEDM